MSEATDRLAQEYAAKAELNLAEVRRLTDPDYQEQNGIDTGLLTALGTVAGACATLALYYQQIDW